MAKVYNSKSNAVRAFRTQFAAIAEKLTNDQIRADYLDEDDGGWVLIDPAAVQAHDDAEQARADAEHEARQAAKAKEEAAKAKSDAEYEASAGRAAKAAPAPAPAKPAAKPAARKGVKVEANREERNGVKRPSAGGVCRAVWDECDARQAAGTPPTVKGLKELAPSRGWNPNNAAIEFYQWRKFNGITGRAAK